MDVKFYEVFHEEKEALEKFLPQDIQVELTHKTIQEEGERSPPAKLISVRTQSRIPIRWAKGLRGILTRSQGYDHIQRYYKQVDIDIICGYLGNYCARAVAEHAVLIMMGLLRKIKTQLKNFKTFHLTPSLTISVLDLIIVSLL